MLYMNEEPIKKIEKEPDPIERALTPEKPLDNTHEGAAVPLEPEVLPDHNS
jgi:hypothetical protein